MKILKPRRDPLWTDAPSVGLSAALLLTCLSWSADRAGAYVREASSPFAVVRPTSGAGGADLRSIPRGSSREWMPDVEQRLRDLRRHGEELFDRPDPRPMRELPRPETSPERRAPSGRADGAASELGR